MQMRSKKQSTKLMQEEGRYNIISLQTSATKSPGDFWDAGGCSLTGSFAVVNVILSMITIVRTMEKNRSVCCPLESQMSPVGFCSADRFIAWRSDVTLCPRDSTWLVASARASKRDVRSSAQRIQWNPLNGTPGACLYPWQDEDRGNQSNRFTASASWPRCCSSHIRASSWLIWLVARTRTRPLKPRTQGSIPRNS